MPPNPRYWIVEKIQNRWNRSFIGVGIQQLDFRAIFEG